jgi:hypothetical protein
LNPKVLSICAELRLHCTRLALEKVCQALSHVQIFRCAR